MQPRDAASLVDILEAAKLLQSFLEGVDRDAFETDLLRQSAVTRQIEVIGGRPNDFRANSGRATLMCRGARWPA